MTAAIVVWMPCPISACETMMVTVSSTPIRSQALRGIGLSSGRERSARARLGGKTALRIRPPPAIALEVRKLRRLKMVGAVPSISTLSVFTSVLMGVLRLARGAAVRPLGEFVDKLLMGEGRRASTHTWIPCPIDELVGCHVLHQGG